VTAVEKSERVRVSLINAASRAHAITHRADSLVSITGGKLTTFRAMAADVLAHARRELPKSGSLPTLVLAAWPSESTPLPGDDIVSREATMGATLSDVLVHRTQWPSKRARMAVPRRIAPLLATMLRRLGGDTAQQLDAYDRDVARLFTIDGV